jgi:RNA polymerase sigma factor (sigma-70 family)
MSIAEQVRKAIEGDQLALKEIYRSYSDPMFNICMRMTGNREDAEDIVQESFINAFNKLRTLKDPNVFGGWLRQIVINNCLAHAKNKRSFEALSFDADAKDEPEDDSWLTGISFRKIHEAIKKLPEGCRQIFLLYAMEDFKHKEIAQKLNISESTSKSQYLRAKTLLADHLKKING